MRVFFVLFIAIAMTVQGMAQQSLIEEFKKDPSRSASNSVVYPEPPHHYTAPPKGKKPFYLSHYGRHGSRYLTKKKDYDYLTELFGKAKEEGKLTALGEDVLERVKRIADEAHDQWGDLTQLGIEQQRDIAHRMVKNFPEIFRSGIHVDARSTLIPRCVLSMTYALLQLEKDSPKLNITSEASWHDMYYMNLQDKKLIALARSEESMSSYENYRLRNSHWDRLLLTLFNDTAFVHREINPIEFNYYLFRMAGSIQNTELSGKVTLYDLYTQEEIMTNWRIDNSWWYLGFGPAPQSSGLQPFTQRNLLRKIIEQADSCIALPYPNAQLRFGHDTMVLPLVCLMGINGYDQSIADFDSLGVKGWINHYVFPMSCNLQLVFYRKNKKDKDVVIKVLLNENEATLPIKTDIAPYYHWSDVRDYMLRKLASYQEP